MTDLVTPPVLEVSDLRKSYGDRVVLADIDLTVPKHDVVCLIGSSGSGKSTLLRCLNLLEQIDDGVIRFDGVEISDPRVDPRTVRRRIGMVFQAYNLFPHLTVLDNCVLAPVRVHGVPRDEAVQRARDLLARFGLSDQVDKHPDRLSGGQQQRAALVRALCTEPELLLLDEITAALDPELVGDVLTIVRDLAEAGHHDGAGHPRDELRPRGREHRLLPRRRPDPRAGAAGPDPGRAGAGAHPAVPAAGAAPGGIGQPGYIGADAPSLSSSRSPRRPCPPSAGRRAGPGRVGTICVGAGAGRHRLQHHRGHHPGRDHGRDQR